MTQREDGMETSTGAHTPSADQRIADAAANALNSHLIGELARLSVVAGRAVTKADAWVGMVRASTEQRLGVTAGDTAALGDPQYLAALERHATIQALADAVAAAVEQGDENRAGQS